VTIAEILADEDLRRREFPVAGEKAFLAHAGVAPLPQRVAGAIRNYAAACTRGDQESVFPAGLLLSTRERAAQLIHASTGEIALVGPTSLALSFIAAGLDLNKGDNVLIYQDDYPSNVYPWMALSDRGVEVRFLNVRETGRIRPLDVLGQVDEQTRLVALSSCHFLSGYRLDLGAIGRGLRQRNILFSVDAIQTLGAFPTTVEHIDFLAADAHKWLLGPCAAGILYVRKEVQHRLRPVVHGWNNVRCPDFVAREEMEFRADARRYEAGTHNLLGVAGLHAALELLSEAGVGNIATELLRKRARLVSALTAKGYQVLHAGAPSENASGIVTFFRPGTSMPELHRKLESSGVVTSLRTDRAGCQFVRLSPHFYNTDAELERCLDLLPSVGS